jgi:cyclopropane fatty-acyl-phospholipid synthase-like methyltransferase
MHGLDDWLSVARSADPDDLREHILSGYKSGKPFTPYVPTIELPSPIACVLDFGCGVGRTFPYLKTIARHVTGFDLPPMIERCRTLAPEPADLLMDDWNAVKTRRFDLIVAALVLQHIEPVMCRSYLVDFARMAPVVYVLTRAQNDFGPNVLDLVAEAGVFAAETCIKVDHDSQTHQLQVLDRTRFDDARQSTDAGHYEVLLRSRILTAG